LRHGEHGWQLDDGADARRPRAPEQHEVFVGREAELAQIDAALQGGSRGRIAIVAVQGMAGVGKTYLAHELYAQHRARFGAYLHVVIDPEHPGSVATSMTVLGKQAAIDAARADESAVLEVLREQRALVHIDNVDSVAAAQLVAALSDALAGIPMLVTGRYTDLGSVAGSGWVRVELAPLDPDAARRLLQQELVGTGIAVPETELRELVRQVAGLPLALHLAAGYLRRGITVERFLEKLRGAGFALDPRDPADHLRHGRVRGVLSTSFAISRDAMLDEADPRAWGPALAALGWAPKAGFGRSLGAAITGLDAASGQDRVGPHDPRAGDLSDAAARRIVGAHRRHRAPGFCPARCRRLRVPRPGWVCEREPWLVRRRPRGRAHRAGRRRGPALCGRGRR